MKIWQKIFLLSFLCAVLLVNITSSVIAWRYFQSTLQKERIHETNDTIALISNISDYIEYTKSIDNKLILSEDTVREIIQKSCRNQIKSNNIRFYTKKTRLSPRQIFRAFRRILKAEASIRPKAVFFKMIPAVQFC